MKRYTLVLLALFFSGSLLSQTYVSGGIYSNATWTKANSPYIVTDNIVVFPDVVLTIEPGVEVRFADGKTIEIRQAYLNAIGTAIDSIFFTSNSTQPYPGIYYGLWLNGSSFTSNLSSSFKYCKFKYAEKALFEYTASNYHLYLRNSVFVHNINAFYGYMAVVLIDSCSFTHNNLAIKYLHLSKIDHSIVSWNQTGIDMVNDWNCISNSVIEYNSTFGIRLSVSDTIKNCHIRNNVKGIASSDNNSSSNNVITGNYIEYNDIGLELKSGDNHVSCNELCFNYIYSVYIINENNINISNNHWCSTDSATLAGVIYDGYDNILLGLVNYLPFAGTWCNLNLDVNNNTFPESPFVNIYPNPACQYATIEFEKSMGTKCFVIYNLLGTEIQRFDNISGSSITFDRGKLSDGIYYYSLSEGNEIVGKGSFILE